MTRYMRRPLALTVLLLAFLLPSLALAGERARVTARVDGLGCPFCAYGIEKKIKGIEGVEEVSVDIRAGSVTIMYRDRESFSRERLDKAIRDAGFTPGEVRVDELKE
jgi:mercuric ion binding protein